LKILQNYNNELNLNLLIELTVITFLFSGVGFQYHDDALEDDADDYCDDVRAEWEQSHDGPYVDGGSTEKL